VQTPFKNFKALWNWIDLDFNKLVTVEVDFVEKNPEMFYQKKRKKKKDMNILDGIGVSKLSGHFHF